MRARREIRAFENPTKVQLASRLFYAMFSFFLLAGVSKQKKESSKKKKDGTSFALQISSAANEREEKSRWSCV